MCWLNWHLRCLRCCSKKLIWIVLMVGVVYVYELVMFNYGPTALKLRSDIDKLKKEIACANKELKLALQGIRRDFEGQLFALQRNVHHDAKNGHIKELLPDFIDMIKRIVAEEIQLYDADKTGLADYALGGSILSAIYTKIEVDTILGIPIHNIQGPEYIIQPCVIPGTCWAFEGSQACVLIELLTTVYVFSVSIEHIPAIISPTGRISSAPRDFSVWGFPCCDTKEEYFLGQFSYKSNGSRIQFFEIEEIFRRPIQLIQFRFMTNQGDPMHTCVYRVRVHGQISL